MCQHCSWPANTLLAPTLVHTLLLARHTNTTLQELQELHSSADVRDLGIRVQINEADITDIGVELDGPLGVL